MKNKCNEIGAMYTEVTQKKSPNNNTTKHSKKYKFMANPRPVVFLVLLDHAVILLVVVLVLELVLVVVVLPLVLILAPNLTTPLIPTSLSLFHMRSDSKT